MKIVTNSKIIDSPIQQFILNAVTFVIATAVATIQVKHKGEMLSLREIIQKSLLFRDFFLVTSLPNLDTAFKAYLGADFLSKALIER